MGSPKTYGLTHIALGVTDLQRTKKFYMDVLDMQIMYDTDAFIQLTTPGSNDIIVFEKSNKKELHLTGGIAHFGFRLKEVTDFDEVLARVIKSGAEIVETGEFVPGSPYVFFKDPDGYEIEIWYELI